MGKELNFDGYWEGEAIYSCDCCGKEVKIRFDDEDSAKDYKAHWVELRGRYGWSRATVNGNWHDFCSESCRNRYIRNNTL